MGEILTDYIAALEKYGRPRGPFEVGRESLVRRFFHGQARATS